jgi:cell division septation protein DedD
MLPESVASMVPFISHPTPVPQPIPAFQRPHGSQAPGAATMASHSLAAGTGSMAAPGAVAAASHSEVAHAPAAHPKVAAVTKPAKPAAPAKAVQPKATPAKAAHLQEATKPAPAKPAKVAGAGKRHKGTTVAHNARGRHHHGKSSVADRAGSFTVQVGAFSQPENAQNLISALKTKGFDAYGGGEGAGSTGGTFLVASTPTDSQAKAKEMARKFKAAGLKPRVKPDGSGHFVVALGSYGTQEKAAKVVSDLNAKGLFASVSGNVAKPSGGTKPNRVWVGHFKSRAAAEAEASRLRSSVGAAMVVGTGKP